jgi:preprotein translocase subunit SecY
MVSFQTKNSDLGKFWRYLEGKIVIYFMAILNILRTFGIFYNHLVHFMFIWFIFFGFGIMYQEQSGNPVVLARSEKNGKRRVILGRR